MKNYNEVISDLRKNASVEFVNGCIIKGTSLVHRSNGDVAVKVTLNKEVHAYVLNDDGDYVDSRSNVIYVAPFAFGKGIEECEDIAFLSSYITTNPALISAVLSYAKCDVACEPVTEGSDYLNPFSSRETTTVIKHDNVFHHVVNIKPSKIGLAMADRVMEKLATAVIGSTSVTNNNIEVEI